MLIDVDGHDDNSLPAMKFAMIVSSSLAAGAAINDCHQNASYLHYNVQRNQLAFEGASAIASHT